MSHPTACNSLPFFCTNQTTPLAAAYCPCDGCMSRFSCRGCGHATAAKSTSAATLSSYAPTPCESRADRSSEYCSLA
ncbi:hypothetical protein LOC68_20575 [Blastopirellula sp. JC732]|uniref:Uncharacterized protein n=1 Tax=Blastopirellula sediminis TaxID=2894196 RepID=A0A9X1MQB8_9BACT|nr:hypothetical protein [Blastopirellula sediminis]MCC9605905.1 hypothetical protein [Blastopirellula sediminis]MCC9630796.1 hypothetical protein [Blastopirellula sediminis]